MHVHVKNTDGLAGISESTKHLQLIEMVYIPCNHDHMHAKIIQAQFYKIIMPHILLRTHKLRFEFSCIDIPMECCCFFTDIDITSILCGQMIDSGDIAVIL